MYRIQLPKVILWIGLSGFWPSAFPLATPDDWQSLNETIGGRLQAGVLVSQPCFLVVNGQHVSVNQTACAEVQQNYHSPLFRVSNYGAWMQPQWETCQRTGEQCLLDSTTPTDPLAWTAYDCSQGSISPYYIEVQNVSDVQVAFRFTSTTGVPLSIKNTGHDYKGRAGAKGSLALWISYNATFTPEGCTTSYNAMTLGAGVGWQDAYQFADKHNVTIVCGYHQTVGSSGGWVMGGGHSILSPNYGLGIDRVLQFKIVTPDGIYRTANDRENPDLFWALRGGGGGTFGIVMETTHRVEPAVTLQVADITFNATSTNMLSWLEVVTNHSLEWGRDGWGGHIAGPSLIHVTPKLSLSEALESMAPAIEYALSQNGTAVIETLTWWRFFQKYVTGAQAAVGTGNILGTRLMPISLFETTEGRAQIMNVLSIILDYANQYIVAGTPLLYDYKNGSTSATPAWRNSLWLMSFHMVINFNDTLAVKQQKYRLVTNVTQHMRDISPGSGAYFNEGDVYEPNHETSYWGPNYPQLVQVKEKYDPEHLLDCWQCVGWRGADDSRYSCYV
ncbi:isoamyl alcohol oxidase [Neolentinus lepideus HHB14362 ss-1]|uniref:Isoamyl alcohol oxidase n=1 Tax=Neolentinus lepideus HHB14362 ss-1 TaxID=1314782 RepID=A0A165TJJ7_9AGAM|nr:isoamyl alcohol oxidase [Neolentinus lepideus HHB14362 ss-1]